MHISLCLGSIIFSSLISTLYSLGPGPTGCLYDGDIKALCNRLSSPPVSSLPENCSSFLYNSLTVDLNYNVNFSYSTNVKKTLQSLIESRKPVYLYIGHKTREEWTQVIGCGNAMEVNAIDEMKGLKAFLDQYPGIKGFIICALEPNENTKECPNFSKNLGVYLSVMKKTFPDLIIGVNIRLIDIINYNCKPHKYDWLEINDIDDLVVFYLISFSLLNECTEDLKYGGIYPLSGSAPNTLVKAKCVLDEMKITQNKLIYRFNLMIEPNNSPDFDCKSTYSEMCLKGEGTCDACADTQNTLNLKGQFAKNNGAGFIVNSIDYDDTICACKCNTPYPGFQALLNGYYSSATGNDCRLFNRK